MCLLLVLPLMLAQVVGSQARILYVDALGRIEIAEAINNAVKDGRLKAPVVISRDHHDVRFGQREGAAAVLPH